MRKTLAVSLFVVATFTWALAQTGGSSTSGSQQSPSASPQTPGASQSAPSGSPAGQMPNASITEGCLGGSNGNYTLTDKAGTKYKLSFPANADISVLSSHVGESVAVMGEPSGQTINVSKIGRGATTCAGSPGASGSSAQPPKQ